MQDSDQRAARLEVKIPAQMKRSAERSVHGHAEERHRTGRIGWLRAAVLGANDGIVSTSSLVLGVAAAHGSHGSVLVAGIAGLVAGAMSMAAGEYVSVHSQADSEKAELDRERAELLADDKGERRELTAIYVGRGLDPALAKQVADQLMAHDALGAHARDELGISETFRARPIQAALASAGKLRRGRRHASAGHGRHTGIGAHSAGVGHVAGVSRAARRSGGVGRRCGRLDGRPARDVLGRARDGRDRGRRFAVRNDRLKGSRSPLLTSDDRDFEHRPS